MDKQAMILTISGVINIILLIILKVVLNKNKILEKCYKSRAKACDEVWEDYIKTVESFCKESMEKFDKLIELEKENKRLKTKLLKAKDKGGKG